MPIRLNDSLENAVRKPADFTAAYNVRLVRLRQHVEFFAPHVHRIFIQVMRNECNVRCKFYSCFMLIVIVFGSNAANGRRLVAFRAVFVSHS